VFIVIRGADLAASMSAYLIEQVRTTPNIELLPFAQIKEVCGPDHLEAMMLDLNGTVEKRPARALFVFIGAKPNTERVSDQVLCDSKGFLLTGRDLVADPRHAAAWKKDREPYLLETCVPGIFTVGDSRSKTMARVASTVGESSMAIKFVPQYLDE